MSVEPAQSNIPENGAVSPVGGTDADASPADSPADTGHIADQHRRHYVGRHRRSHCSWCPVIRRIVRFWPSALRAGLLVAILVTGTTALAGSVGVGAQMVLIVMEVWDRKG